MPGRKIVDETLKFEVVINGDDARKEFGQLERANRKLKKTNDDLEKQAKKLERSRNDNREAIKKLRAEIAKNNKSIAENENRMKGLTKEIGLNNLSMGELRKEAKRLSIVMSKLDPESEKWAELNKELKAVKGRMGELSEEMKPVKDAMEDSVDLVGNLAVGLGQFFTALSSGDAKAAKAAILSITDSLKGATKAAWSFIATPIGAAIAVIAGIGLAAKEWFNYNESVKEAIILTQQITGLQGEQANATRLQAEAIADTFDVDFVQLLGTANTLVNKFNISFTEALDEIQKGLIKGQKNNDEYFDSLNEYPIFFAAAGFSVSEFRKVVETGWNLGIYTDKLPDAIKEADLALREQTDTTREALINAFGAPFTDQILSRVKKGEISVRDALGEIAAEAAKTGLDVQQNAQLTADLFKGAGEDAGGALVILDAFNQSLNVTGENLTPLEQMFKDVADANQEFAKAQDEALKSDNYVAFTNSLKLFWISVKTQFFKGIKYIIDLWTDIDESMQIFLAQFITTVGILPTVAKQAFVKLKDEVWDVIKTFKGLGDVLENLMAFNFKEARKSFNAFKEDFKNEVGDVKDVAVEAMDKIKEARRISGEYIADQFKKRREAASEQTSSEGNGIPSVGNVGNNGRGGDNNELSPEDKKKLESRKRLAELLDQFEEERALQEQLKAIDKEKRAEEEEVLRIESKFQKLQEQAAGETELLARLEAEKESQIQDVRDKYSEIRLKKNDEARKKLLQASKEFNKQQLESEKKLEEAKAGLKEQGLEMLRRIFGESSVLGKAFYAIQKGMAIANIVTENSKANALVAANLSVANTKAIAASPLTFGQPWVAANSTAAAASLAANNSAAKINIAKIVAETVAGIAGFEDGLYPVKRNDGKVFRSRFGGEPRTQIVTAPTHFIAGEVKPEMIIDGNTFRKMDPAVTDYILALSGRMPGFEGGMYRNNQKADNTSEMMMEALAKLNQRLDEPIYTFTVYDNDASVKQQEFDDRIKEVRRNAKIKK